jgi:hypothetical protein
MKHQLHPDPATAPVGGVAPSSKYARYSRSSRLAGRGLPAAVRRWRFATGC